MYTIFLKKLHLRIFLSKLLHNEQYVVCLDNFLARKQYLLCFSELTSIVPSNTGYSNVYISFETSKPLNPNRFDDLRSLIQTHLDQELTQMHARVLFQMQESVPTSAPKCIAKHARNLIWRIHICMAASCASPHTHTDTLQSEANKVFYNVHQKHFANIDILMIRRDYKF